MAMSWANTQPALLRKLKRFGGFTSTEGLARFYQSVIDACNMIRRGKEWDWKNVAAGIETTEGNLGPYDAPATFQRMALERKIYAYGFTDTLGQVLAPVLSTDSERFAVVYREEDGKLYFRRNPGSGTVTFNFVATLDNDPTEANAQLLVESMPGNLSDVLQDFIEADMLDESPDTKQDSIAMLNKASAKLEAEYAEFQKARGVQKQRSPRGMDGRPFDGIAGQTSLRRRSNGLFPRGRGNL